MLTVFRKPEAARNAVDVAYVGFDIPNEFVVGYGLDYDGHYRNLTSVGHSHPTFTAACYVAEPSSMRPGLSKGTSGRFDASG